MNSMVTRLVILIGFVVAFAAGLMLGFSSAHRGAPSVAVPTTGPATRPSHHRGFLTAELGLSPDQQTQLNQIWSETARSGMRGRDEQRRQYRKERDDAIAALVHPEELGAYDQILDTYSKHLDELDRQSRAAFESGVQKTKALLTPEQRTKYEAMLNRNQWEGGPRDRGSPRSEFNLDEHRRPGDRGTTQATSNR